MVRPLYVLVHSEIVKKNASFSDDAKRVQKKLDGITLSEEHILINGEDSLLTIAPNLLNNPYLIERKILVCGAYSHRVVKKFCVDLYCDLLRNSGYNASVYEKGTLFANHN